MTEKLETTQDMLKMLSEYVLTMERRIQTLEDQLYYMRAAVVSSCLGLTVLLIMAWRLL